MAEISFLFLTLDWLHEQMTKEATTFAESADILMEEEAQTGPRVA